VKIFQCRGSALEIATDNGTVPPKKTNVSAPKRIIGFRFFELLF